MEIGIDSFAAVDISKGKPSSEDRVQVIKDLIDRIVYADEVGIDKNQIKALSKLYHKQNFAQFQQQKEEIEDLYESVVG